MSDLGTLGGSSSLANGINDFGQVVGESKTLAGETHAFLWDHGTITDLGKAGETSSAHSINNQGEIVGAISSKSVRGSAVRWKNQQRLLLADLAPTGSGSTAFAVNVNGDVTGVSSGFVSSSGGVVRAVVWQGGIVRDIGTLGGMHSTALALNDLGDVVGWAETPNHSAAAFLWHDGVMRNLKSLAGGVESQSFAVNKLVQVVGSSLNSKGESRAVIWDNGKITDLNDLVRSPPGLVFARARGINNRGQILVEVQTPTDGTTRSFLLTPR
jgi:probable HAF family extracellular repeat protein